MHLVMHFLLYLFYFILNIFWKIKVWGEERKKNENGNRNRYEETRWTNFPSSARLPPLSTRFCKTILRSCAIVISDTGEFLVRMRMRLCVDKYSDGHCVRSAAIDIQHGPLLPPRYLWSLFPVPNRITFLRNAVYKGGSRFYGHRISSPDLALFRTAVVRTCYGKVIRDKYIFVWIIHNRNSNLSDRRFSSRRKNKVDTNRWTFMGDIDSRFL